MKELIGTLLIHELILNKMNEDTKGKKTIALKVNEEEEDDETSLLTRTFARLMKKKGNECKRVPPTCYKCKKINHM